MADPPALEILKVLEALQSKVWEGRVWRHMFGDNHPERRNQRGARWNPAGVPAIYCSVERATAIAEGDYVVAVQSLRPAAKRTLYQLDVHLDKVLDLTGRAVLRELHIGERELSDVDHAVCQNIGGAVEWLEHDGLLVPSARHEGINLVIFPRKQRPAANFDIVDSEIIAEDSR